jgi:uncharacterized membrane protein YjfL (UPF0719 family)
LAVTTSLFLVGLIVYFSLTAYRELQLLRDGILRRWWYSPARQKT